MFPKSSGTIGLAINTSRIGSRCAKKVFKKSKQVRIEIPAHWLQCNVPGTKDESRNEENARVAACSTESCL